MTKEGSTSHGNWPHPLSVGTWELAELYLYDEMAFRSGYCRVQSASIITEKKHFPFKQRNQQPCTTRPEKKKVEQPQNKQIFSWVSGSLERIKQDCLYWSCSRTFVLTSASVPIYAAGFYTPTSGGHSNFRLLTDYLQNRRPEHLTPSMGEGKHSHLNLFPNHCSVLEAKRSQKLETEIPQGEGEKAFPWCEQAHDEKASSRTMWEAICGTWGKVSTQKGLVIFCWSLGRRIGYSWIFQPAIFQNERGTTATHHKQNCCFINLLLFSSQFFTLITMFWVVLLFPFDRLENWGLEIRPKVTQQIHRKAKMHTRVFLSLMPEAFPTSHINS